MAWHLGELILGVDDLRTEKYKKKCVSIKSKLEFPKNLNEI